MIHSFKIEFLILELNTLAWYKMGTSFLHNPNIFKFYSIFPAVVPFVPVKIIKEDNLWG